MVVSVSLQKRSVLLVASAFRNGLVRVVRLEFLVNTIASMEVPVHLILMKISNLHACKFACTIVCLSCSSDIIRLKLKLCRCPEGFYGTRCQTPNSDVNSRSEANKSFVNGTITIIVVVLVVFIVLVAAAVAAITILRKRQRYIDMKSKLIFDLKIKGC